MSRWYTLDENNIPIKTQSIQEYIDWETDEKRIVKQDNIGKVIVSTVFLGLDHSYGRSIPILWETMIFEGEHDGYQDRYSSYEDALKGHQKALDLINK